MTPDLYSDTTVLDSPRKLSQEAKVKLWQDRVAIAKKAQETWGEDSGAKRFVKQYKGDYGIVFHTRTKQIKVPPINEVFAYTQADIATTYARDPYITVNAEAGTPKGAALWEANLNYWWRKLKTKEEIEYEILDKDLVGYGFHKVGMAFDSEGSGDELKLKNETLYSKFLDWKDVVWNIGSKRPPVDCEWMAQRIVRPIQDIKRKYPAARAMEGTKCPDIDDDTFKKSPYKDDIKVGVLWEIWDAREREVMLMAEGVSDQFLEPEKSWLEHQTEFPFLMYWDFAVPGGGRPMSAIAPWEAQILEEMVLMGSAINHTKRWNRQAFVKNGQIDDNALDKFERGDDGAIIVYNGDNADIKFADFGILPADFYLLMDRLQAIKRNINGQPEFVRGGVTKTNTRTIGELQKVEAGFKGRQDRKIDRFETHLENIARHMMMHLKANFDFEQTLKITGDTPEEVIEALGDAYNPETGQVTFTVDDIQGEYDVDIKAGSTLPLDKATRTQMMEMVLNTVAQVVPNGPVSPFLNALIQEILRDYDIKALEEAYKLEQAQAAQAQAEQQGKESIEDQKTAAEAAKREAQTGQIQVDTQIAAQEMAVGPLGRAQLEKFKKAPPKPPGGTDRFGGGK